MHSALFEPGQIGSLELKNRFVRAATSEGMSDDAGRVTAPLLALHERLARGGVGLIVLGHLYTDPRGRYGPGHLGIHDDTTIPGLAELSAAVHRRGARVFAQLTHAGSQSRLSRLRPVAPSPVANKLTGREAAEATQAEIAEVIAGFANAASRAISAGFDGVHVHAANGYLLSEFCSPVTNLRTDSWGGSAVSRDALVLEVVRAIRAAVPADYPVSIKLGMADAIEGGLDTRESLQRARRLVDAGVDAIEVSVNVMARPSDSARTYVAVDRRRAVRDLLPHRVLRGAEPEAYFATLAHSLRAAVDTKVILVGGLRSTEKMTEAIASGEADFVAMSRPFIREPDIVNQISGGRVGTVDCTSCNLCLDHSGHHTLRCWRVPRRRLLQHALYRLRGGLRPELFEQERSPIE